MRRALPSIEVLLPVAAAVALLVRVASMWAQRVPYPFDLEWMEGGVLAHAWRLERGLPLYVAPDVEFVPFVYPPGYPAVVAALGQVFGLSPSLGRLVSLAGTIAAAAAIGAMVRRHGGSAVVALCAATAFVGAWPATGAFYDLVRPDGLFVGALAWSAALALDGRRGTPVAAGLLLAVAFLAKHNAAAFGLPLVLVLAARDGLRPALGFAAAAALPALAAVGWLEAQSDGRFLQYLVAVPASHPSFAERVWLWSPRELGTPMPFVFAVIAAAALQFATDGQRAVPKPVAAIVPVAVGMLAAWRGTYAPPPAETDTYNAPASVAFFAFGAVPVAVTIGLVGRALERRRPLGGWELGAGLVSGVVVAAVVGAMRAHNGGFVNVHIPFFVFACVVYGVLLSRWLRDAPRPAVRGAVVAVLVLQALWAQAHLDRRRLVPQREDLEAGWRFVDAAKEAPGDVLSPFASWIPVHAGKPPSLHYQAAWDLDYPGGPFAGDTERIALALAEHRWAVVLGGNQKFPYGLLDHYEVRQVVVDDKSRVMMPMTGWRARPNRILVPKAQ